MVVTGTSLNRGDTHGKLVFMERQSLDRVLESNVSESVGTVCVSIILIY